MLAGTEVWMDRMDVAQWVRFTQSVRFNRHRTGVRHVVARLFAAAAIVIGCGLFTVRPVAAGTELEVLLPPGAVAREVAAPDSVIGHGTQPLDSVGSGAEVVDSSTALMPSAGPTPVAVGAEEDADAGTATVTGSETTDGEADTNVPVNVEGTVVTDAEPVSASVDPTAHPSAAQVDVDGTVISDSEPTQTSPAIDEAASEPDSSALTVAGEPGAQPAASTPSREPQPTPADPLSDDALTGIGTPVGSSRPMTLGPAPVRFAISTDARSASLAGGHASTVGPSTPALSDGTVPARTGFPPLDRWVAAIDWSRGGPEDGVAAHEWPMGVTDGIAASGAGLALVGQRVSAVSVAVDFARSSAGWAGPLVFNTWLRRQLRERRMSQRRLGMLAGVNHSAISRLINGHASPTLETATKLVHALHMEWTDDQIATYFDLLPEHTLLPTQRVESALRGDGTLGEDDIKAVMHHYLALRTRRKRGPAQAESGDRKPIAFP